MQLEVSYLGISFESKTSFTTRLDMVYADLYFLSTGRYKWLVYLATLMSASAYALLILRWHGNTNWWESLYIFPG